MPSTSLADLLSSKTPRETSGPRTSNRYDYQKDWAICKLIELHQQLDDYLLLLDYHEDAIVLDSEKNPEHADFYQIKSKSSGNWTIAALTKQKKHQQGDPEPSILEKLYSSYVLCGDYTRSLHFESNRGLSGKLFDSTDAATLQVIPFSSLSTADKERVHRCLEGDSADVCNLDALCKIYISKTILPVESHGSHTKGILVDYLDSLHPGKAASVATVYRVLFDEVRRKTGSEWTFSSFETLRKEKGFGASDFNRLIKSIADYVSANDVWATTERYLVREGISPLALKAIRQCFFRYAIERMDSSNEEMQRLKDLISSQLESQPEDYSSSSLTKLSSSIANSNELMEHKTLYGLDYISAAIMFEVSNYESVQKIDQESKGQTR